MFRRILLPTDFSEGAVSSAVAARRIAEQFGASLHVLHVLDEPVALDPMFRGDIPLEMLRERMGKYAAEGMEAFVAANLAGLEGVTASVVSGVPYREIVRVARESNADLIVIGTHGRTGVEHVLFGSTAEKVVRNAQCPVLTIRIFGGQHFVRP